MLVAHRGSLFGASRRGAGSQIISLYGAADGDEVAAAAESTAEAFS